MKPGILIDDWLRVLRRAWSVRFMFAAAVFSAAETALPYLNEVLPIPPGLFAGLSAFATGGAIISRFLAQKDDDDE